MGCQASSADDEMVTHSPLPSLMTPSLTVDITMTSTPMEISNPTLTPTKTAQPTPTEIQTVNCGEIFCSMPWRGWLERPIGDDYRNTIDTSYPYASTRNWTLDPHHGVELVNSAGTPVLAAQSGEVIYAGYDDLMVLGPYTGFYGNVIILWHPDLFQGRDVFTLYAHLSAILVEEGDQVDVGDVIGQVGASGSADGSHLHFEVRLDVNDYDHTTNPVLWFAPVNPDEGGQSSLLAGVILDNWENQVSQFQLSLEKLDEEGGVEENFYPITYYPVGVNSHPVLQENFTVSDLPPGDYRLAFISGRFYEVNFTLEPGELGFIKIKLD